MHTNRTMVPDSAVRLTDLCEGEKAWICSISDIGEYAARLTGLGLCDGANVHIIRNNDPVIVRVCESKVGIAFTLAKNIWVTRSRESDSEI